jgi:TRAP-type C4-dicarboxylate transport system permease small subunit
VRIVQLAAWFIGSVVILVFAAALCYAPFLIFETTYPWTPEHWLAHDFMTVFLLVFAIGTLWCIVHFLPNPRTTKEDA